MSGQTLIDKYSVVDTLYTDPVQSVYYVDNLLSKSDSSLILNELKDREVIPNLVHMFLDNNEVLKKSFIEFCYKDSKFYVVSKLLPGQPLGDLLEGTSLELNEKIAIATSFVEKLAQLENMPLILQYVLCNFRNISVMERKSVFFNLFFSFTQEDFKIKKEHLITRTGDILLAIFLGTVYACPEDIDQVPPQFRLIIKRCLEKEYQSTSQIHDDFKTVMMRRKNEELCETSTGSIYYLNDCYLKRRDRNKKKKMRKKKRHYMALVALLAIATFFGFTLAGVHYTISISDFTGTFSILNHLLLK